MKYEEPVFRPPSEAYSLIFQVTIGCSWNNCAFCEMYTSKKFRIKSIEDVRDEIRSFAEFLLKREKFFWLMAMLWFYQQASCLKFWKP
ncbi:MAG: hypothetical protein K8R74_03980 [Bacteroidales bacterium]|nr:hypothetical protein [Bacteroidales bacterium]